MTFDGLETLAFVNVAELPSAATCASPCVVISPAAVRFRIFITTLFASLKRTLSSSRLYLRSQSWRTRLYILNA